MLARTGTARQVTLVAWAFRRNREPIKQDGVILIDPTRYELQRCSRITAEKSVVISVISTSKTNVSTFLFIAVTCWSSHSALKFSNPPKKPTYESSRPSCQRNPCCEQDFPPLVVLGLLRLQSLSSNVHLLLLYLRALSERASR